MKIKFLFVFCIFLLLPSLFSQGYKITVKTSGVTCDSLFLQEFKGKKFKNFQGKKNAEQVVFKANEPLRAGIYQLTADSTILCEFLISDAKNQQFTILYQQKNVVFEKSAENSAYQFFQQKMAYFETEAAKLDKEFQEAQQGNMPQYMLQNLVNNLRSRLETIETEKKHLQDSLLQEFSGNLLASVIKNSLEIPAPPQSYYQNKLLLYAYFAEHSFDSYPIEDERLINSPIAADKIKNFGNLLYQFEDQDGVPYLKQFLKKIKVSTPIYYYYFDQLEQINGSLHSPFWSEPLYIAMLQDALTLPDLEMARKIRYENQLKRLNKNLKGSQIPDFQLLMSDSTKTNLYSIESEYMLLYFQNPDCPTCTTVRDRMAKMDVLNDAIASGKVTVLTVYFEQDEALWRRYLKNKANPAYLHGWEYPNEIETNELFDLRIIPYIFLLDKNKKVLKKDLLVNEIEYYIKNL